MSATLYDIHDPMCSWCWGFRPVWQSLRNALPVSIQTRNIVGGLAADNDEAMSEELQQTIQNHWRRIHKMLGTEFNFDFWHLNIPRRATYMACRAVLAAKCQKTEEEMIEAIQQAYYLRALNPSDTKVLIDLCRELHDSGIAIDTEQFSKDLRSDKIEQELQSQINFAIQLGHQGFPSLILQHKSKYHFIDKDYYQHGSMLAQIISYSKH